MGCGSSAGGSGLTARSYVGNWYTAASRIKVRTNKTINRSSKLKPILSCGGRLADCEDSTGCEVDDVAIAPILSINAILHML